MLISIESENGNLDFAENNRPDDDFDLPFDSIPDDLNITKNILSKLMLTEFKKEHGTSIAILEKITKIETMLHNKCEIIVGMKLKDSLKNSIKLCCENINDGFAKFKINYFNRFSKGNIWNVTMDKISKLEGANDTYSIEINSRASDGELYTIKVNKAMCYLQRYLPESYELHKESLKFYFFEMCAKLKEIEKQINNTNSIENLYESICFLKEYANCFDDLTTTFFKFSDTMNRLRIQHLFVVPSNEFHISNVNVSPNISLPPNLLFPLGVSIPSIGAIQFV